MPKIDVNNPNPVSSVLLSKAIEECGSKKHSVSNDFTTGPCTYARIVLPAPAVFQVSRSDNSFSSDESGIYVFGR